MNKNLKELVESLIDIEFNLKETMGVLQHDRSIFWSWGGHNFCNVNNRGLLFLVSAHHHKGYVLITLNGSDYYDVHIISTHGNLKESFKDVCFEDLVETIDNKIERIVDYKF